MARTKNKLTEAQRAERAAKAKAKADALAATLDTATAEMRSSEGWKAMLDTMRLFHRYSMRNLMLIGFQKPDATRVAGFTTWKKLGRQVRRGEKGLQIFGYAQRTFTTTDEDTGEETTYTSRPFFPVVHVFDISQTEPIEGAEDRTKRLELPPVVGDDEGGIFDALVEFMASRGWTVEVVDTLPASVHGRAFQDGSQRIEIASGHSPASQAATLIHECAHALMHPRTDETAGEPWAQLAHVREVEAESVAYVVAGGLGLDTSLASVHYITAWASVDTEVVTAVAERVKDTAHLLLDALTSAVDSQGVQAAVAAA